MLCYCWLAGIVKEGLEYNVLPVLRIGDHYMQWWIRLVTPVRYQLVSYGLLGFCYIYIKAVFSF